MLPEEILKQTENNEPWPHTIFRNAITPQCLSQLLSFHESFSWDNSSHDDYQESNIKTFSVKQHEVNALPDSEAKSFLNQLLDKEFYKKIFEYYNVDYKSGWEDNTTLSLDLCYPNAYNENHNDSNHRKDTITLQYYLRLDDSKRSLFLNDYDTKAMPGSAVMFKSNPTSMHSFIPGEGYRYSLRLRLGTNLVNPYYLHDPIDSDIGVLIDAKDMESDSHHKMFEVSLANVTRKNLIHYGMGNIVVYRSANDFQSAVETLHKAGVKRILLLFAGAMIGEKTKELVKNSEGIIASVDNNNILRQYVVFNTENKLDISGKFLDNVKNIVHNRSILEMDIAVLHPDEESVDYLNVFCRFEIPLEPMMHKLSTFDKHIATTMSTRLQELL